MKRSIALISEHASPLATLGGVDNGGQNVYVAEVSQELVRHGYNVDVYTRRDATDLPEVFEWMKGLRVIHVDAGPPRFVEKEALLQYMPHFADWMIGFMNTNEIKYDIVHANFFMSAYVAMILKQRIKLPFVVTFHALGLVRLAHQKAMDRFPAERFQIEKDACELADAIIAECPQDRADLIHYYHADQDKIHIVPCGCNLKHFYPIEKRTARRVAGVSENEFVLLQLGRMVPRKGVENVIRAAGLLKDQINNLRVLVVGGDSDLPDEIKTPEISRLKNIAREAGVSDCLTFTGRKQRDELKYYYNAADIFVTTPWYEPFGITPLEAMACGTPVIGSRVGGIKYTVQHGRSGLLVAPKDPDALKLAVLELAEDKALRKAMGQEGLSRVKATFTWQAVATAIDNVYNRSAAKGVENKVIPISRGEAIIRQLNESLPLTSEE